MLTDRERLEWPKPEGVKDTEDPGYVWVLLSPDQAEAMAGGYVPRSVKSVLREMLDQELEDQKRAERPPSKRNKRK